MDHLTVRGNARQNIYLDDTDRHAFLRLLGHEVLQQRWQCYAYCLMRNHYHLLIETPDGNLVPGMRRLNEQKSGSGLEIYELVPDPQRPVVWL